MHRLSLPLVLPFLLSAAFASAAEKPVHIFILSGQSNMAGMNPKTGFEPEAKKLFPDAEVVYIKVSQGGKPIRFWVKEWNDIADKHGLSTKLGQKGDLDFYQQIREQFQALLEKHPQPASVTFCWMQGERDSREKLSAAYSDALTQLIANLRRDLQQPKMNFVIGRISDWGQESDAQWQKIREVQVSMAEQDPLGAWADCDDLNNKQLNGEVKNDLHYTAQGYELLGCRFARQAKSLIDGKESAKDGRPE